VLIRCCYRPAVLRVFQQNNQSTCPRSAAAKPDNCRCGQQAGRSVSGKRPCLGTVTTADDDCSRDKALQHWWFDPVAIITPQAGQVSGSVMNQRT
jgi:hypothetical protein